MPERLGVPGFINAERWIDHLRDAGVSRSAAWADAANTRWTERMRPHFRDLLILRMNRYQPKA